RWKALQDRQSGQEERVESDHPNTDQQGPSTPPRSAFEPGMQPGEDLIETDCAGENDQRCKSMRRPKGSESRTRGPGHQEVSGEAERPDQGRGGNRMAPDAQYRHGSNGEPPIHRGHERGAPQDFERAADLTPHVAVVDPMRSPIP